jgi:hypothetical protein
MVYIWSDLHLGHANIIKYSKRPFSNVEEMDEALLHAWRTTVKPLDTIINLGYCFQDEQRVSVRNHPEPSGAQDACPGNCVICPYYLINMLQRERGVNSPAIP